MIRLSPVAAILAFIGTPTITHAEERPNVVIVFVDDFGWGDPSCYGNTMVKTPQMDRLAKEGVRFTQGYVASPICSPSRCGLLTGQFPARWRITSFLQTKAGNRACEMADFLDPKAPSLPRLLKESGYATAHIGKWHLGGGRDVTDAPKFAAYGYDIGLGTYESPEPAAALGLKTVPWGPQDKIEPQQVPRHQRSAWMIDETLSFIKKNAGKPCFVNLWLDDTHTPFVPSPEQMKAVKIDGEPELKTKYKAVLAALDEQIGRLLDGLIRLMPIFGCQNRSVSKRFRWGGGVFWTPHPPARRSQCCEIPLFSHKPDSADDQNRHQSSLKGTNTLLLFVGDNGASAPFERERSGGLRGQKLSLYEGGVRVPFMAWWPTKVKGGIVNEKTVISTLDFLPTLATICGAKHPKDYKPDGEDLTAALRGELPVRTKSLFWEYGRNNTSFAYPKDAKHRSPNVAIRDGDWKLIVNADGSGAELYDLASDANETNNLAANKPEITKRLAEKALAWRKSVP